MLVGQASDWRAGGSNRHEAERASEFLAATCEDLSGGSSFSRGSLARSRLSARPSPLCQTGAMIFRAVGDGRPYPEHGRESARDWADVPPRMVRLDELVTTKRNLDLATLLSEESTFYGDLFAHVVQWNETLYLEDGLHRALRAALQQRPALHARVLVL